MKAVVKARREPGLWLEDVPVPEVGGDDVLIRVLKAAICGRTNAVDAVQYAPRSRRA
jgi:threonine dehydrogenase-like Zn-dependent dehydrogenase